MGPPPRHPQPGTRRARDSHDKGPTGPRAGIHCDFLGAAGVRNFLGNGDGGTVDPGLIARDAWQEGVEALGWGLHTFRGPTGSSLTASSPSPSAPGLSHPPASRAPQVMPSNLASGGEWHRGDRDPRTPCPVPLPPEGPSWSAPAWPRLVPQEPPSQQPALTFLAASVGHECDGALEGRRMSLASGTAP